MVLEPSYQWLKKHWKGYILLMLGYEAISDVGAYVYTEKDNIKTKLKSTFTKK